MGEVGVVPLQGLLALGEVPILEAVGLLGLEDGVEVGGAEVDLRLGE